VGLPPPLETPAQPQKGDVPRPGGTSLFRGYRQHAASSKTNPVFHLAATLSACYAQSHIRQNIYDNHLTTL